MATANHKPGYGSLFTNNKQKETHADYTGNVNIDGKMYRIAGWKRTSKNGVQYLSLSASPAREEAKDNGGW